jgi:hypothetical protein
MKGVTCDALQVTLFIYAFIGRTLETRRLQDNLKPSATYSVKIGAYLAKHSRSEHDVVGGLHLLQPRRTVILAILAMRAEFCLCDVPCGKKCGTGDLIRCSELPKGGIDQGFKY